jgi:hypothetical protein
VVGLTHGGNRYDDDIFEHTLRDFPEFAAAPHAGLIKLDEDWMKSKEGKERWRAFINACVISLRAPSMSIRSFDCSITIFSRTRVLYHRYEGKVTDYNFGSLIRADATREYSETNTIFGTPSSLDGYIFFGR